MKNIIRIPFACVVLLCLLVFPACVETRYSTEFTTNSSSSNTIPATTPIALPPLPASAVAQLQQDLAAQTAYGKSLKANSSEAELFGRAVSYIKLYMSLPSANEQVDLAQIENFLEPSSTISQTAEQIWEDIIGDSQQPYQLFSQTVISVSINADGANAVVICKNDIIWLQAYYTYKPGDIYTDSTSVENWQLLNGVWYLVSPQNNMYV